MSSAALLGRGTADQKTDTAGDKVPELGDRGSQRTGLCQRFVIHPHVPQKDQRHQTEKPDTGGDQNLRSAAASRLLREHGIALKLDLSGICLCAGDKTDLVYRAGEAAYGGFRRFYSMHWGGRRYLLAFFVPGGKVGAEEVAEDRRSGGADDNVDTAGELAVPSGEKQRVQGLQHQNGHNQKQAPIHQVQPLPGCPDG